MQDPMRTKRAIREAWVEDIAQKTVARAPAMSPDEQRLSLAIYEALADAESVTVDRLVSATGMRFGAVEAILARWPGVFRKDDGALIGFWGLTSSEMGHQITIRGDQRYAWCAWDTLFLPELLNAEAEVVSRDPQTREEIRLTVGPHGIIDASHDDIYMSYLLPESALDDTVVSSFCHQIHFFTSEASAREFAKKHDRVFWMTLEEGAYLARRKNVLQYGSRASRVGRKVS